jgi:putative PIN family toxin of toxin-antitoxin system
MSQLVVYDCMLFFMRAARPDRGRETFQLVDDKTVIYCLSPEIVADIQDVLTRPRHRIQFPQLTRERVTAFLDTITRDSHFMQNVPEVYVLARDSKDSKYINLAIAAEAPFLVTRDNDLLDLMSDSPQGTDFQRRFSRLRIVDPASFVRGLQPPKS